MRILAFNTTHDSSVCSINDGELEFFCKEERLTRVKRDKHPYKSLESFLKLNKKIDHCLYHTPSNFSESEYYMGIVDSYETFINKYSDCELENYSGLLHHDCHSNLAFYNSNFDKALIFVIDRNGSVFFVDSEEGARESESVYIGDKDNGIKPIYKNFWLSDNNIKDIENAIKEEYDDCDIEAKSCFGIVTTYEAATTLIGQDPLENGKTMGLASYSDKQKFIPLSDTNLVKTDKGCCFAGYEEQITDEVTKENYKFYAEKAKHVQEETQRVSLELIKKYVEKTSIKNVCVVGGYGLNVVANNYYIKNLPDVNFYFEPVADDTGISIGAAMKKYFDVTGKAPKPINNNFYHYYEDTTLNIGEKSNINEVCDMLCNQRSVALFESNPESGPRALGHRSILFDARNKYCKDIVNKIKNREWYRPFAGVILEHRFEEYFETLDLKNSEAMTINFNAKKHTKEYVPGIVHVDGTCRIQTVSSGFLFDLLVEFEKRTGCPMLLNTSFNLAGEPLVQSKGDAIYTFNNSLLDAVYFVDDEIIIGENNEIQ